jgi:hypothetical protein
MRPLSAALASHEVLQYKCFYIEGREFCNGEEVLDVLLFSILQA